ncbi:hypothetical protein HMPREF3151_02290 [Corynebacterium sp. HMSC05H05]|uniref:Rib/alpha-like domain-containing protein n=1 Tax=Corynebacterium sp. HMSC05H05 TaxID=1581119 RepID=UPI0008A50DE5|nr:YPDG domain-containing protein [Corynebacterium sp. HMSC05H05]OFT59203.1 hypothetical protein HMPREF3151_02290 [Corynebacterium sp. HMSC05H05]
MNTTRIAAAALAASLATTVITPAASAADWMSQAYNPSYADTDVTPGATARIPLAGNVPAGTTFDINSINGWDFDVDADGTVAATPRGQFPGAYAQNYVTITYPDHTVDYALFTVRVAKPSVSLADSLDLAWGDATVAPGGTVTLRPSTPLPDGTQLAAPSGSGGWRIDADQDSGEVTVAAPAGARAGAGLRITLGVVFPDGSTKQYSSRITVGKADRVTTSSAPSPAPTITTTAAPAPKPSTTTTTPKSSPKTTAAPAPSVGELSYPDTAVSAGDRVTVFLSGALPEGSRVIGPNQRHNGWTLETDEDTGAITFSAPRNAQPGYALVLKVTVLLPDGSRRDLTAKAYVPTSAEGAAPSTTTPAPATTTTPAPSPTTRFSTTAPKPVPTTTRATPARPVAETAKVSIDNATITAGESIVVTPKGLPAGARVFVTEETRGGWTIAREGETGIRITAAKGMRPGNVLRINAAIQFADYSSVNRTFDTRVVRGQATGGLTTAPSKPTPAPAPTPGKQTSPAGMITGIAVSLGLLGTLGLVGRFFPFF